jgi:hypothetical protein
VNLAELSLSGSLMPSVPEQILLKYDPPKMTLVYHFEGKEDSRYYHEIHLDKQALKTKDVDELANHLYISEAYYFNPKQIRRE